MSAIRAAERWRALPLPAVAALAPGIHIALASD
jgi:hypothetical protein